MAPAIGVLQQAEQLHSELVLQLDRLQSIRNALSTLVERKSMILEHQAMMAKELANVVAQIASLEAESQLLGDATTAKASTLVADTIAAARASADPEPPRAPFVVSPCLASQPLPEPSHSLVRPSVRTSVRYSSVVVRVEKKLMVANTTKEY